MHNITSYLVHGLRVPVSPGTTFTRLPHSRCTTNTTAISASTTIRHAPTAPARDRFLITLQQLPALEEILVGVGEQQVRLGDL